MSLPDTLSFVFRQIEALRFEGQPRELYHPIEYSLKNGGKRMRPAMTIMACQMFGGDPQKALHAAIGLELFHNFTLMHDDIMDNATIRRGLPAVHTKWNANTAILSGDAMFALAGSYVSRVDDACLRPVIDTYHATALQVCEGQQLDMNFETRTGVSLDEYIEMIRLKTAVLPAACLKIGAIVGGATQSQQDHIYNFGQYIGLAFQLKDDWLDAFGNEARFGKKTGGDIIANKKTWLYIKALELANGQQRQTLLMTYAGHPEQPGQKIKTVTGIFLDLGIDKLGKKQMEEWYQEAFRHFDLIEVAHAAKEDLRALAGSLFDREL